MQEDRSGKAMSEQYLTAQAWTRAHYCTDNVSLTCRQIVSRHWKSLFDGREAYRQFGGGLAGQAEGRSLGAHRKLSR
jgi:hypothetical protein